MFFLLSGSWWWTGVSGGCCQTTSEIGENPDVLVVSGLSHAIAEWICGVLSLKLRLQPGDFQLCWSVCLFVVMDFVPSVFYSVKVVYLLSWLQKSISLWSGSFWHCSHRVGRQFLISVISVVCSVGFALTESFVVVGIRVCLTTVIKTIVVVTGTNCVSVILVFLFLELTTLVLVVARLFAMMTCRFGFLRICFFGFLRHSVDLHFVCSFQTN